MTHAKPRLCGDRPGELLLDSEQGSQGRDCSLRRAWGIMTMGMPQTEA